MHNNNGIYGYSNNNKGGGVNQIVITCGAPGGQILKNGGNINNQNQSTIACPSPLYPTFSIVSRDRTSSSGLGLVPREENSASGGSNCVSNNNSDGNQVDRKQPIPLTNY